MHQLEYYIDELEAFIPKHDLLNTKVSSSPVGWHIEHALLVIDIAIASIKKSVPGDYTSSFSFWKTVTFTLGKFPRGRARAPKAVMPTEAYDADTLLNHLYQTKEKLKAFEHLYPLQYMKHPIFGKLHKKDTQKFLVLHTKHHLAIISDMLK
jgi:hypothetical protein